MTILTRRAALAALAATGAATAMPAFAGGWGRGDDIVPHFPSKALISLS